MGLARALVVLLLLAAGTMAAASLVMSALDIGGEVVGEGVRVSYVANGLSRLHIRVSSGGELAGFTLLLSAPGPSGVLGLEVSGHGFAVVDAQPLYAHMLETVRSHSLGHGGQVPLTVFYVVTASAQDGRARLYTGVVVVPLETARLARGDTVYIHIDAERLRGEPVELQGEPRGPMPTCVAWEDVVHCVKWRLASTWRLDALLPLVATNVSERLQGLLRGVVHDVYISSERLDFPSIVVYGGAWTVVEYQEGFSLVYPWEKLFADIHCTMTPAGASCETGRSHVEVVMAQKGYGPAVTGLTATVWVTGAELVETILVDGTVSAVHVLEDVFVVEAAPYMTSLGTFNLRLVAGPPAGKYVESARVLQEELMRERGASIRITLADCARKAGVEPRGLLLPVGQVLAEATGVEALARANPVMLLDAETLYGAVYVDLDFGRRIVVVEPSCYYLEVGEREGYVAMVVTVR